MPGSQIAVEIAGPAEASKVSDTVRPALWVLVTQKSMGHSEIPSSVKHLGKLYDV